MEGVVGDGFDESRARVKSRPAGREGVSSMRGPVLS